MKKYIFLIIIGLSFVACKKKSTIHITAKNIVTGKPYPGLRYSIVRSKTGLFESHYKTVASGSLNENGEAYITKYFSKNWSHDLSLENPENTCYSKKDHYYFSGGENVEANFEFAECGYLKLSVHNANCQGSGDIITFDMEPTYNPNYDLISPNTKEGCYSNTFIESQVASGPWKAEWTVTRSGLVTHHDTLFIIHPSEHYHLVINY